MKVIFDFILIIVLFFSTLALQSSGDSPYVLPRYFHKTEKWIKEENVRRSMAVYNANAADTTSLNGALQILRKETKLSKLLGVKAWCIRNYQVSFPYLVQMLTDTNVVGLSNTNDLIIPGRTTRFDGSGPVVKEDLYRVSGRASYILNQLTGESFAVVTVKSEYSDLVRFQQMWRDWINRLPR